MLHCNALLLYTICLVFSLAGVILVYRFYSVAEKTFKGFQKKLTLPLLAVVLVLLTYVLLFTVTAAMDFLIS